MLVISLSPLLSSTSLPAVYPPVAPPRAPNLAFPLLPRSPRAFRSQDGVGEPPRAEQLERRRRVRGKVGGGDLRGAGQRRETRGILMHFLPAIQPSTCRPSPIPCCARRSVIRAQHLGGELSASIGALSGLEELIVWRNAFTGEVPAEVDQMTALRRLDLSGNQLAGSIPSLLSLTNLMALDLGGNKLTGRVAENLATLKRLLHVDLSNNSLGGTFPRALSVNRRLTFLVLASNRFEGNVPWQWGQLQDLETLDVSSNNISGTIPLSLAHCTRLHTLLLQSNNLSGEVPMGLAALPLQQLSVADNALRGRVNASFHHLPLARSARLPVFEGNPELCVDLAGTGRCSAVLQRHGAPPHIEQRRACAHGQVELCSCADGAQGQRACVDAKGFTACMCPSAPLEGASSFPAPTSAAAVAAAVVLVLVLVAALVVAAVLALRGGLRRTRPGAWQYAGRTTKGQFYDPDDLEGYSVVPPFSALPSSLPSSLASISFFSSLKPSRTATATTTTSTTGKSSSFKAAAAAAAAKKGRAAAGAGATGGSADGADGGSGEGGVGSSALATAAAIARRLGGPTGELGDTDGGVGAETMGGVEGQSVEGEKRLRVMHCVPPVFPLHLNISSPSLLFLLTSPSPLLSSPLLPLPLPPLSPALSSSLLPCPAVPSPAPAAVHLTMLQFTLEELSRATNAFHSSLSSPCPPLRPSSPLPSPPLPSLPCAHHQQRTSPCATMQGEGSEGAGIVIKEVEGSEGETAAAFAAAVEVFAFVRCPHLVEVLGCCCTPLPAPAAAADAGAGGAGGGVGSGSGSGSGSGAGRGPKVLVYEMAPNGTLDMHLHDLEASMAPLPWPTRMAIALDVAKGLAYLHAMTPQMTHAALTTASVALDSAMRAKLADYCLPLLLSHPRTPAATAGAGSAARGGAASAHSASVNMAVAAGTAAPELAWVAEATPRVDVYAFGVLLLEVISGRRPLDAMRPPNEQSLVHWAKARLTQRSLVERMVDPLIARAISTPALYQVAVLASQCIHSDPDTRPTMLQAVEVLSRVQSLPLDAGTPHSKHHLPTCGCDDCNGNCAGSSGECAWSNGESRPSASPSCCSTSPSYAVTHASTTPCISLGDIEQRGRLYSATRGINLPESTTPLLPTPLLSFDAGTLLPPVLARGNSATSASVSAIMASADSAGGEFSSPARDSAAGWGCGMTSVGTSSNGRNSRAVNDSSDKPDMAVSRGASFKRIVGFAIKEDGCVSPRNSRDAQALTGWEVGNRVSDAPASAAGYEGRDTYGSEQQENAPPRGSEGAPPAEAQVTEDSAQSEQVPRESFYAVSARSAEEQAMLAARNVKGELKSLTQMAPSQRAQNGQQPMAEQRGVTGEASSARWWVSEDGSGRKAREESCMSGRHGDSALRRDAKRMSRLRH
ncbi:unnamed protein product [Closterium sp. NIES-64]|nr:unnamed protein product [Closterium sp. NIES-64]